MDAAITFIQGYAFGFFAPSANASDAVKPALVSIQTGMKVFQEKATCVACHHQGLGLMTLGIAAN